MVQAFLELDVGMAPEEEQRLVSRLQAHDEHAFNELVTLYQQRLFRLVARMLGDQEEARDLTHEVFITVFKAIGSFRGDSKLSTWLYRIATNHAKNRIKYLARRKASAREELTEASERDALETATLSTSAHVPRPDEAAMGNEMQQIVQRAIATLHEDHRELLVLAHVENLAYEEIQEITGLPVGTVKSRLHRARIALKEAIESAYGSRLPENLAARKDDHR